MGHVKAGSHPWINGELLLLLFPRSIVNGARVAITKHLPGLMPVSTLTDPKGCFTVPSSFAMFS